MKTFLHYFRRYRLAMSLNILGIAITLAGLYVLCLYIDFNRSYNRCFPDYETLYRLDLDMGDGYWNTTLPRPLATHLEKCPQIEELSLLVSWGWSRSLDKDGTPMKVEVLKEPGNLLTMMGARRVDGTLETKSGETSVVIPASLAMTLYGDKYAAGRELKWSGGDAVTVAGVYEDFPDNCCMKNIIHANMGQENLEAHSNYNYNIVFRSKEDPARLQEVVTEAVREYMRARFGDDASEEAEKFKNINCSVMPIDETYFSGHDRFSDRGRPGSLSMQVAAAILLLIICVINFTNFSMAQAPMRIRAVLTRKVLGESLWHLRCNLLGEAAMVGVLAYVLAMFIVWVGGKTTVASELITMDMTLSAHPVLLAGLLGTAICIGLFSAAYSTRYITSFPPVSVMKGNVALTPQGQRVRMWLVGLQICISLVMVIFIGTLYGQSRYIFKSEYGYAKDSILIDDTWGAHQYSVNNGTLRTELEQLPCVQSVSFSQFNLGTSDGYMTWGRGHGDKYYNFSVFPVDWKFLRTYGIDIVEGRDFKESDGDVYIINEAMKRQYPELETDKLLCDGDFPIVGICKDFRSQSTRVDNSQIACAFFIFGEHFGWGQCRNINIRMAPGVNIVEARRQIAAVLDKYAEGDKSDLRFLDQLMEDTYREELTFIGLMKLSSVLTILITLIGVFCLTMFETEYRRKEIAIRKVMGSSVSQVLMLFAGRYAAPLLIAFVVAVPAGYSISTEWLSNFAEHAPVYWWLFPLALIIVSAVVLSTVILQSWRVATMNPFYSIKNE